MHSCIQHRSYLARTFHVLHPRPHSCFHSLRLPSRSNCDPVRPFGSRTHHSQSTLLLQSQLPTFHTSQLSPRPFGHLPLLPHSHLLVVQQCRTRRRVCRGSGRSCSCSNGSWHGLETMPEMQRARSEEWGLFAYDL